MLSRLLTAALAAALLTGSSIAASAGVIIMNDRDNRQPGGPAKVVAAAPAKPGVAGSWTSEDGTSIAVRNLGSGQIEILGKDRGSTFAARCIRTARLAKRQYRCAGHGVTDEATPRWFIYSSLLTMKKDTLREHWKAQLWDAAGSDLKTRVAKTEYRRRTKATR